MGTLAASRSQGLSVAVFQPFFFNPSEKYPARCGEKLEHMISIDKCVFFSSSYYYYYLFV